MNDIQKHWQVKEQIRIGLITVLMAVGLYFIAYELHLIVLALNICKI